VPTLVAPDPPAATPDESRLAASIALCSTDCRSVYDLYGCLGRAADAEGESHPEVTRAVGACLVAGGAETKWLVSAFFYDPSPKLRAVSRALLHDPLGVTAETLALLPLEPEAASRRARPLLPKDWTAPAERASGCTLFDETKPGQARVGCADYQCTSVDRRLERIATFAVTARGWVLLSLTRREFSAGGACGDIG